MFDINAKSIKLIELANTWQGEGPDTGRAMLIVRFKHCNRKCSYCDTWVKMKVSMEGSYSISDINDALKKTKGLMITGGEPTLNYNNIRNLDDTLKILEHCDYQIANIETNGYDLDGLINGINTIKNDKIIRIIYSPKIFSDKDFSEALNTFDLIRDNDMVVLKIVADPNNDRNESYILQISGQCRDKNKIYLMPLGTTRDELDKNFEYCVNLADQCDVNLSSRFHIMSQFI